MLSGSYSTCTIAVGEVRVTDIVVVTVYAGINC